MNKLLKKYLRNCKVCGKETQNERFCSLECFGRRKPRKFVERICKNCKRKFLADVIQVKLGHYKFCSNKCRYEGLKKEGNPNWINGWPKCINCNKELHNRYAKRCWDCYVRFGCRGENSPMFGKHLSKKAREKIGDANRNKKHSKSSIKKGIKTKRENAKKRGFYHSEEVRNRMRKIKLKKFSININYFKKLNIRNAYILGYLFADGHIGIGSKKKQNKHHRILNIITIDKEFISKIIKEFGAKNRKMRIKNAHGNYKTIYSIGFGNLDFIKHLENLGMVAGKKSKRLFISEEIEKNDDFFLAFFRGFFDGDGWVSIDKQSGYLHIGVASMSRKFLSHIKQIMLRKFNIRSGNVRVRNGCARLVFCRKNDVIKLYKLMYKNAGNLFLDRKKQRFEEWFRKEDANII